MEAGDETLLRQLIAQVSTLTAKIENIGNDLDEKVRERRKHFNGLETRLAAIETRTHTIELLGAKGETLPQFVADHEKRIRVLESMRWQILALAFLGSGAGWIVTNLVL